MDGIQGLKGSLISWNLNEIRRVSGSHSSEKSLGFLNSGGVLKVLGEQFSFKVSEQQTRRGIRGAQPEPALCTSSHPLPPAGQSLGRTLGSSLISHLANLP